MVKKIYYIKQVIEKTNLTEQEIREIEEEGLIEIRVSNNERYFIEDDLERLRLIKMLRDEFDINLPGIDVILHMRNKIIELQENFVEFITQLKEEIKKERKYLMNKEPDDIMIKEKGEVQPIKKD